MKHMDICRKPRKSTITLGRAAGLTHAKRRWSVTNPTVMYDDVFWFNLTFILWRSQEIHSLTTSRAYRCVRFSERARPCILCSRYRYKNLDSDSRTDAKQICHNAGCQAELFYSSSVPLCLQHKYCIVSLLLATAPWALCSGVAAWTVLTVPC